MVERLVIALTLLVLMIPVAGFVNGKKYYPHDFFPTVTYGEPELRASIDMGVGLSSRIKTNSFPGDIIPLAGICSHHIMVWPLIDAYFTELKRHNSSISTFIILSPNHFYQGTSGISISKLPWSDGVHQTGCDQKMIGYLLKKLNLKEDPTALYMEHGIGALVPFICKYYPDSRIVPVVINKITVKVSDIRKLADRISEWMKKHPGVFVLLSTDFSHHESQEKARERDQLSEKILWAGDINYCGNIWCDNSAGIRCLFYIRKSIPLSNIHFFCHTDSDTWISRHTDDDTSYFFSFFF